jgi:hypothetical protein
VLELPAIHPRHSTNDSAEEEEEEDDDDVAISSRGERMQAVIAGWVVNRAESVAIILCGFWCCPGVGDGIK